MPSETTHSSLVAQVIMQNEKEVLYPTAWPGNSKQATNSQTASTQTDSSDKSLLYTIHTKNISSYT